MDNCNIDIAMLNFTTYDYKSDNGMFPTVWGPLMWHFLHIMSFNYPNNPDIKTKKYYYNFILNLQNVLPCKICRNNLKKNLKQLKFSIKTHMKNRYTFSKFIYSLHDKVNKMLGKKASPNYVDVRNFYECFLAKYSKKNNKEIGCNIPKHYKKYKCIIGIEREKNN